MSVARSSHPSWRGRELDAGQRLDRAAGRGDSADGLQLCEQSIALERDLHDEYLRKELEVIEGMRSCGELRDLPQIASEVAVEGGQASLSTVAVGLSCADTTAASVGDLVDNLLIVLEAFGDALAGVQDGGVVAPAEGPADRRQRRAGEIAREVDGHLARPGDRRRRGWAR